MPGERLQNVDRDTEFDWIKQRLQREKETIQSFTDTLKKFLEEGMPIEKRTLSEALEAEKFLEYQDKEGPLDLRAIIYEKKRSLGIGNDRFYADMQARAKNFAEALFWADAGHTYYMRGPDGELSNTVPVALKKRMLETTLEEITELSEFYKKNIQPNYQTDGYPHLDEPISALTKKYKTRYAHIRRSESLHSSG